MSRTPSLPAFKGGRILVGVFLLLLFGLLLGRWASAIYVDILWFATLDLVDVFSTRFLWEGGARLLVGGVTALFVWLNLKVVAMTFAGLQIRRRFGDLVIQEQLPESYVRWGILLGCLFMGLWFAIAVPQGTGLRAMLLLHADPWGQTEPIFGQDLGFYIFLLPILQGMVTYGLVLTVFLAALSAAGYAGTGAITWGNGRIAMSDLPRLHLGILAGAFLLLLGFRFYLAPFDLLLDGNSAVQGIFGYADHEARVSAYRMVAFLSVVTAGAVFWGAFRGFLLPVAAGGAALAIGALVLAEIYPSVVQRFQVQPNELDRETRYIQDAIEFTRLGFGMDQLQRDRLNYVPPDGPAWDEARNRLPRLPVWTETTLLTTFRQIEARFQYYDFHKVAFDRYPAGNRVEPVGVSVREINPVGIPDPNWQNLHLRERYISGMGAVAGELHRRTGEGRLPMFLAAIPPEYRGGPGVPEGLDMTRPQIHIGSQPQLYSVINPTEEDFLAPDGSMGEVGVDFPQGVLMGSIFRTLILAWRFQDANLLLASEVGPESRLLFRRQVQERVRALAPFLHLPEDPYPIVADGRVVWILEGFTVSDAFPLSRSHQIPGQRSINYLRNSIKATVDAVTGETRLYVVDPDDPLIRAYRSGFPSLFHSLDDVPPEIAQHLRYSQYQLEIQARVLTRFHQAAPPVFHGQQDQWALATQLSVGSQPVDYGSEYSLLILPGEDEETYVLSTLFVPQGRQNLASFLAARWTPAGGPELLLWDAPVEEQIRGPRQIEAMIEQDPEISQQFALWRQAGSQVWTGHLHLIPVGNSLFYMEPIFLAADTDAIPEIRRYVVSDGERVVMDLTLDGAITALEAGLEGVTREGDLPEEGDLPDGEEILLEDAPLPPSTPRPRAEDPLQVLDEAEESLREGDWEGFGRHLRELREILGAASGPGGGSP